MLKEIIVYSFSLNLGGMLDRIEKELPKLGLTSFKITGSTPSQERQEMTKAFNQGERDVFLNFSKSWWSWSQSYWCGYSYSGRLMVESGS